jgi:hypothetical protein
MRETTSDAPRIVRLQAMPHAFGELVVAEKGGLPFEPRRAYFVHGIPSGARRGGHAHRTTWEAIIPLRGEFRVTVEPAGAKRREFRLADPAEALLVPALCWVVLDHFSEGASFLVAASASYDEGDYIRDRGEFERLCAPGGRG